MGAVRENAAAKGRPHLSFTFALATRSSRTHNAEHAESKGIVQKNAHNFSTRRRVALWKTNHPLVEIKSSSALLASDCRAAQLFGDLNAGVSINFLWHFLAQKFKVKL